MSQKSMREIKGLQGFVTRSFLMEGGMCDGRKPGQMGGLPACHKKLENTVQRKNSMISTKFIKMCVERARKSQAFGGCSLFLSSSLNKKQPTF